MAERRHAWKASEAQSPPSRGFPRCQLGSVTITHAVFSRVVRQRLCLAARDTHVPHPNSKGRVEDAPAQRARRMAEAVEEGGVEWQGCMAEQ